MFFFSLFAAALIFILRFFFCGTLPLTHAAAVKKGGKKCAILLVSCAIAPPKNSQVKLLDVVVPPWKLLAYFGFCCSNQRREIPPTFFGGWKWVQHSQHFKLLICSFPFFFLDKLTCFCICAQVCPPVFVVLLHTQGHRGLLAFPLSQLSSGNPLRENENRGKKMKSGFSSLLLK